MTNFRPGQPLPRDGQQAQERQLYYAERADGQVATMTVENGVWQWRRVRGGEGDDAYGTGSWATLQVWLNKK